ncbi:hypothetical protein [Pseudomonas viridiflava]|uniref:hypothetical protein n=1 Tax=Pseudomonas viridiflava TaxID=33069 RepID=UPI001E5797F7|nr:hypothetical protein [Pseudomonas viridiflava]
MADVAKRLADTASANGIGTDVLEAPLRDCLRDRAVAMLGSLVSEREIMAKFERTDVLTSILTALGVEHQILALLNNGLTERKVQVWLSGIFLA